VRTLGTETRVRRNITRTGIAAVIAAAAAAAGLWTSSGPNATTPRDVMLLYVGAEDCGPCRRWQRADEPGFRTAPEFSRVTYRAIKSPSLLDILRDEYWPDDLRPLRERIRNGAAVPLWLVVADDVVVQQAFGESEWRGAVLPKLRALLR
jgi:hypothetical protein